MREFEGTRTRRPYAMAIEFGLGDGYLGQCKYEHKWGCAGDAVNGGTQYCLGNYVHSSSTYIS